MAIQLNHTIVTVRDAKASADFLAETLGLPVHPPFGPFLPVGTDNEVTLDLMETTGEITPQHYAFLVAEADFDAIFDRVRRAGLTYFADPLHKETNQINHNDGGRGMYFDDPNGHSLEVITRPYGSGG
jgi:catechol 2,3-dioxygenase-like lactoylglutathione lyase family enzyme